MTKLNSVCTESVNPALFDSETKEEVQTHYYTLHNRYELGRATVDIEIRYTLEGVKRPDPVRGNISASEIWEEMRLFARGLITADELLKFLGKGGYNFPKDTYVEYSRYDRRESSTWQTSIWFKDSYASVHGRDGRWTMRDYVKGFGVISRASLLVQPHPETKLYVDPYDAIEIARSVGFNE